MSRKCSSLKHVEEVVFRIHSDIYGRKIPMNGTVVMVFPESKTVDVSWLEGYKYRTAIIAFEDMMAVHNPTGKPMKFDSISGRSDLLTAE